MSELQIEVKVDILLHEKIVKNRAEKILPNLKDILKFSNLKDIWVENINKFSFELVEGYSTAGTIKCNRRDITLTAIITTVNCYEKFKFLLFKKKRLKKKIFVVMKKATNNFY
jgi:hypothetical protein